MGALRTHPAPSQCLYGLCGEVRVQRREAVAKDGEDFLAAMKAEKANILLSDMRAVTDPPLNDIEGGMDEGQVWKNHGGFDPMAVDVKVAKAQYDTTLAKLTAKNLQKLVEIAEHKRDLIAKYVEHLQLFSMEVRAPAEEWYIGFERDVVLALTTVAEGRIFAAMQSMHHNPVKRKNFAIAEAKRIRAMRFLGGGEVWKSIIPAAREALAIAKEMKRPGAA